MQRSVKGVMAEVNIINSLLHTAPLWKQLRAPPESLQHSPAATLALSCATVEDV